MLEPTLAPLMMPDSDTAAQPSAGPAPTSTPRVDAPTEVTLPSGTAPPAVPDSDGPEQTDAPMIAPDELERIIGKRLRRERRKWAREQAERLERATADTDTDSEDEAPTKRTDTADMERKALGALKRADLRLAFAEAGVPRAALDHVTRMVPLEDISMRGDTPNPDDITDAVEEVLATLPALAQKAAPPRNVGAPGGNPGGGADATPPDLETALAAGDPDAINAAFERALHEARNPRR